MASVAEEAGTPQGVLADRSQHKLSEKLGEDAVLAAVENATEPLISTGADNDTEREGRALDELPSAPAAKTDDAPKQATKEQPQVFSRSDIQSPGSVARKPHNGSTALTGTASAADSDQTEPLSDHVDSAHPAIGGTTAADGLRRRHKANSDVRRSKPFAKDARKERTRFLNVAPLNIPVHRRLEMLGIIWHAICIPTFISLFFLTLSLGPLAWGLIVLPYCLWWYLIDLHTPTNGKVAYRSRDWMKNFIIWDWFVDYFPIRVHKSCDLEPTFSDVVIEEEMPDDEEDLISEDSRTSIDRLFKFFGLRKRLNDDSDASSQCSALLMDTTVKKVKRISTGPRYIFGYHPHGVISMGVFGTFATNAVRNEPYEPPLRILKPLFHDSSKGERLFPGIGNIFPLTLTTQFAVPYYRDYILGMGLTSASAKNIRSLISNGDNSICVVVGGAQESLLNDMVAATTTPGRYGKSTVVSDSDTDSEYDPQRPDDQSVAKKEIRLVLKKRKGFVKIAIEMGNVSLVPTFGFGEADIYRISKPKPGSIGEMFQYWMKKTFQFTVPFFSARGVFVYDFGFLPYRNPINVCFGRPIHIPAGILDRYKETEEKDENAEPDSSKTDALSTKGSKIEGDSVDSKAETVSERMNDKVDRKVRRQSSLTNLFKFKSKPRKVVKRPTVPQDVLDHYHKLYIEELLRVFDENKHKYGYGDVELHIVE